MQSICSLLSVICYNNEIGPKVPQTVMVALCNFISSEYSKECWKYVAKSFNYDETTKTWQVTSDPGEQLRRFLSGER